MNFKDRDVLVSGPVVKDMERSFERFWDYRQSVAGRELKDVKQRIARNEFPRYTTWDDFRLNGLFDELSPEANDAAQIKHRFADQLLPVQRVEFICDKPGKNHRWSLSGDGAITARLRDVLAGCQQQLVLQTPYLVLDQSMRGFFSRLKETNPKLKVVVSSNSFGSTDNIMAYSANYKWRSLYIEDLGFQIYEYKPLPAALLTVFPMYPAMKARAEQQADDGEGADSPFLCIHAKSFVMDDRVAYIGTFNLDPRSANLNTEVGLLIWDEAVAALLKADILQDTQPGNSWVIAKKAIPLSFEKVNALLEWTSAGSPVDLWPVRNTSSFELRPDCDPVPPDDPAFYARYEDVGPFPGDDSVLSPKAAQTWIWKILNGLAAPML